MTIKKLENYNDIKEFYYILEQLFNHLEKDNFKKSVPILLSRGYCFLGLYFDNSPVGFLQYHIDLNLENYSYLVIDELVVDDNSRGKGFGSLLMQEAEKVARESKVGGGIGLLSGLKREGAHEFYKKLGYEYKSKWFVKKINIDCSVI